MAVPRSLFGRVYKVNKVDPGKLSWLSGQLLQQSPASTVVFDDVDDPLGPVNEEDPDDHHQVAVDFWRGIFVDIQEMY